MGMGIDSFRQVSSGWLEREVKLKEGGEGGVRQSDTSRLSARIQGWFRSPTAEQQETKALDRIQVKSQFFSLLVKTEGEQGAMRALKACGMTKDFLTSDRPLTNHVVKQLLDTAQEFRLHITGRNEKALAQELSGFQGPEHRDLRAAISREVKNQPNFGSQVFSKGQISEMRQKAEADHREVRAAQCRERFPGMSKLVEQAPPGSALSKVTLDPNTIVRQVEDACPGLSSDVRVLDSVTRLLGRQDWNQAGLEDHANKLDKGRETLQNWSEKLAIDLRLLEKQAGLPHFQTEEGKLELKRDIAIIQAVKEDVDRQIKLVDAKRTYVDELRLTDPLTDRSVKHSNLVWAHAGQALLDKLQEDVESGKVTLTAEQSKKLADVREDWRLETLERAEEYDYSDDTATLQVIPAPSKGNKDTHPIVQGKRELQDSLRGMLEGVGIERGVLKDLFSKESLTGAERTALAGIDTWQPISREMAVMRDGTMRVYRSEIVPAQFIHRSFGVETSDGRTGGVTAGVKDSTDHARNLKVSRLVDPGGQVMTTVVGHGVLDMWEVEDGAERREANGRGAKEVLEVAVASNPRLRAGMLDRAPDAPPPRLVHVSVNLISPDTIRDVLPFGKLDDYKERTYTKSQFQAFEDNSGPGQTLRVFDPQKPGAKPVEARVDVDTITFSFGINSIATGWKQHVMDVWSNVHAHNTRNMIKLVGDLGEGQFGARATRPGGFVGEVYDRLETMRNNPEASSTDRARAADLLGQLRGQTDLVRTMFTEETFKTGNGDTAKMGREVLVLQGLAEQGLELVKATDLAGTMSKGCKSDKDRGGVTDVELKSKLILRDLGGEMNPDESLQGDDQGVYYTVSASSGQLENQRWNTGMAGSKEASHLTERLPDPEVRQFLSGLGKFAKS